jgi:phosphohistidine phosphatase
LNARTGAGVVAANAGKRHLTAKHHLWIVRHARSIDSHPGGDEMRSLTAEGRTVFRDFARSVAPRGAIEQVGASPLVRATQTAEILAEALGIAEVEIFAELASDADSIEPLARGLGAGWALVGHNPGMAETLARLCGLAEAPQFRKGAIAALAPAARGEWQVAWTSSPGRDVASRLD